MPTGMLKPSFWIEIQTLFSQIPTCMNHRPPYSCEPRRRGKHPNAGSKRGRCQRHFILGVKSDHSCPHPNQLFDSQRQHSRDRVKKKVCLKSVLTSGDCWCVVWCPNHYIKLAFSKEEERMFKNDLFQVSSINIVQNTSVHLIVCCKEKFAV